MEEARSEICIHAMTLLSVLGQKVWPLEPKLQIWTQCRNLDVLGLQKDIEHAPARK